MSEATGDQSFTIKTEIVNPKEEDSALREQHIKRRAIVEPLILQRFPQIFEEDKTGIGQKIAWTQVPDGDLVTFTSAIISAAQKVDPRAEYNWGAKKVEERDFNPARIGNLVENLNSIEDAQLIESLASQWQEKFMGPGLTPFERFNRYQDFRGITAGLFRRTPGSLERPNIDKDQAKAIFEDWSEVYEQVYSLPESFEKAKQTFVASYKDELDRNQDPGRLAMLRKLLKEAKGETDRETFEIFIDSSLLYVRNHSLTDDSIQSLKTKLIPAIARRDPQLEILYKPSNVWGMGKGDFGVGDFLVHSYAIKVTPENINELLMAAREVPATDLGRLEQNRLDGLTLSGVFGILRDFIHDQRPGVHDVIAGMVSFYDTGDDKALKLALSKVDGYVTQESARELILDRENYEKAVEERSPEKEQRKAIDILRRLALNTEPVNEEPPKVSDSKLNELMNALERSKSEKGVAKNTLNDALKYVNDRLTQMADTGEVGVEPSFILALSWLERRSFEVLQGLSYEDQVGVYKTEWFVSLLKFQELTAAMKQFDGEEFNDFVSRLQSKDPQTAFQLVSQRTLSNVNDLTQKYKGEHKLWVGALWSGNVAHELIGMTDPKPAATAYGKRHRTERLLPGKDRLNGD